MKIKNKYCLNLKSTFKILIVFVFLTIIGTVLHELGHYIVAKYYDFKPSLHYSHVSFHNSISMTDIENNTILKKRYLLIFIAGPIQTITTAIAGLILLFFRKNRRKEKFTLLDWVGVFLSLFWLRQSFNLMISVLRYIVTGNLKSNGDEVIIANNLNLPPLSLDILLGAAGFVVLYFVTFKVIPKNIRKNFIVGGFIGGVIGFIIWFYFLGKVIFP
jgi:hypothetical protein